LEVFGCPATAGANHRNQMRERESIRELFDNSALARNKKRKPRRLPQRLRIEIVNATAPRTR
jgi:hypothetical protein